MTESIKQPEAKRLADELERPVGTQSTYSAMQQAAAELRRLHAEVERLRAELSATTERLENRAGTVQALCAETVRLEVERDEARALVETQIIRLDNAHQALVNVRAQRDKAERERDEALIEAKQWENSALAIEVERDEARAELALVTRRFAEAINGPTHMGEPVIQTSGDRDAYEGCREDLLDWKKRAQKAEAELARLTTLRPASEHDGVAEVLWWGDGEFRYIGNEGDDWLCWTTLPDVKETK
jgi:hypothetical protein